MNNTFWQQKEMWPPVLKEFRAEVEALARSIHVNGLAGLVEWRKDPEYQDIAEPFFRVMDYGQTLLAHIDRLEAENQRLRGAVEVLEDLRAILWRSRLYRAYVHVGGPLFEPFVDKAIKNANAILAAKEEGEREGAP